MAKFFFRSLFVLVIVSLLSVQFAAAEEDQQAWLEQQQKIDRLIAQFASNNSATAKLALDQLVDIGEPAVDKLIAGLTSRHPVVRMYSVTALGKIGASRACTRVRNLLEYEDAPVVIIAAVKALYCFGDNSGGEKVLSLVAHSVQDVRRYAVSTLGQIGYEPALPVLLARITLDNSKADPQEGLEKNPAVLCDISLALHRLGNDQGLPILTNLSRHENIAIRMFACQALTHFKQGLAYLALAVAISDPDPRVADLAYNYLYKNRRTIIPELQRMYLEKSATEDLRKAIGDALKELGGKIVEDASQLTEEKAEPGSTKDELAAMQPLLAKLRNSDQNVRKEAEQEIEKLGAKALPALIEALPSESSEVKLRIIALLVKIKDKRALEILRSTLASAEKAIRCRAAWALGELASKSNIPALIEALSDEDSTVRFYVINSLVKLTGVRNSFEARGSDEERAKAIESWKNWWKENEATFKVKE